MESMTLPALKTAVERFLGRLGATPVESLYGVTDGKAVGTYVEHAFQEHLDTLYSYERGSSAVGMDFPGLGVDLKVTSAKQPQSSCPYRDASQKVYGLGYHLVVFVYVKIDDSDSETASLAFPHAIFVERESTGDYQTTFGIRGILERNGNEDDIIAFLDERNLPLDEIGRSNLAERILAEPPSLGCLTISNALQWRLQYGRAIGFATDDRISGVEDLLG
jgi:hypothetical protein